MRFLALAIMPEQSGSWRKRNEWEAARPGSIITWPGSFRPHDDKIRDGAKAAEAIKEAIELMPNEGRIWDTQAAVCAEQGQFDEAVKWEKRYLGLKLLTSEQRKDAQRRLEFYQKRQPYRQGPGE